MNHQHDDLQTDIVAAAAAERRAAPETAIEVADLQDKYDEMQRLADLFDDAGEQMRGWARLGTEILADPHVTESAELSQATYDAAEEEIRAATTGKRGLLSRSIELDADALVLRATVLTYQWIDELQAAAYQTLGSIAGRALGYLAPEVALGGAIVAAGLIETDALDRDGVAAYLNELAEANPELMEHVTTGGGLLDSLQMRALLTAGLLSGESGKPARAGGLRAAGVPALATGFQAALRDAAAGLAGEGPETAAAAAEVAPAQAPHDLTDLMSALAHVGDPVAVRKVADGRFVAYLTGPTGTRPTQPARLRLVSGDHSAYAADAARLVAEAVAADGAGEDARVMLVGSAAGGLAAIEIARQDSPGFVVEQVVTVGAPGAQAPRVPARVRVLSLEDRSDPVALLGSLINAGDRNRLTVVYDATAAAAPDDPSPYVAGGRAADRSEHPALVEELERLRELGYLAG